MDLEQITGRDDSFLAELGDGHRLHPEAQAAFLRLQARARAAGFDLQAASTYRSFERQLSIWNAKARGERAIHDDAGRALSRIGTPDWDWVQAILRYSALPGASRHHWGTDLDVYDAAAVPDDYTVQLTPAEVAKEGPFAPLHEWLDTLIDSGDAEGFFRPYSHDRGGVAPERWHLSYAPLARHCADQLSAEVLYNLLEDCADLALWPVLTDHWQEVYRRFAAPQACASPEVPEVKA